MNNNSCIFVLNVPHLNVFTSDIKICASLNVHKRHFYNYWWHSFLHIATAPSRARQCNGGSPKVCKRTLRCAKCRTECHHWQQSICMKSYLDVCLMHADISQYCSDIYWSATPTFLCKGYMPSNGVSFFKCIIVCKSHQQYLKTLECLFTMTHSYLNCDHFH